MATLISTLKLGTARDHSAETPEQRLRDRTIKALNEQLIYVKAEMEGTIANIGVKKFKTDENGERRSVIVNKRVRRWYWADVSGTFHMELRYGNTPLEIVRGKTTIEIGSKEKIPETIMTLMEAVKNGELDVPLKAAQQVRAKKLKGIG